MEFHDRYSKLDRLLHSIAFRAGKAQQALSDVEDVLYRKSLKGISVDKPVLITALPRSGTTILLNTLWKTKRFASHTYQDMPFMLCPLIWKRFSRRFASDLEPMERAHGDGLTVSSRSPEAFEEMIWKHFWPDHYEADRIRVWSSADRNPEFESFFEMHMRKVIVAHSEEGSECARYLSKNNLNIARLASLPGPLRNGTILVPFRDPLQHAASMHVQHRRFLKMHAEDDFLREYMEAIGHFEFGKGLRPVNFGNWIEHASDPDELSFWLQYWIAAYRFVLAHRTSSTTLISYARLTEEPKSALSRLSEILHLPAELLISQAHSICPPRSHEVITNDLPEPLLLEARTLYRLMQEDSFV